MSSCCCFRIFETGKTQTERTQRSDVSVSNVSVSVVVDQQRSNKLYMLIVMLLLSVALRCMCACVYWCLPAQLRQKCSHSHTHTGGDRLQSFCTKSFLRRISCAVLFFHAHTQQPPLSLTHIKMHRQRGDIKTNKEIRVKTKIKLIRNKYCVHTRTLRVCMCVCVCA